MNRLVEEVESVCCMSVVVVVLKVLSHVGYKSFVMIDAPLAGRRWGMIAKQ